MDCRLPRKNIRQTTFQPRLKSCRNYRLPNYGRTNSRTFDRSLRTFVGHPQGVGDRRRSNVNSLQREDDAEGAKTSCQVLLRGPRRQGQGGGPYLGGLAQQETL